MTEHLESTGDFDPEAIMRCLARHDVEFVIIGGVGALLHGSPRPTVDIDVTPRRSGDNLARLSAALTELDARIRTGRYEEGLVFRHDSRSLAGAEMWNLTTRFGDLDIIFSPPGSTGYEELAEDAFTVSIEGAPVTVASLRSLITMKRAAGRDKDIQGLRFLEQMLEDETR